MKILHVRGVNLTTFDQFEIDFEGQELSAVGLFAITGPTGSGKSTLLDAICLALYGRTPRYTNHGGIKIGHPHEDERKKVLANDPRALMSYGAGYAEAEVDFSRNGRRYRAKWYAKRARLKPEGSLQAPQQHLYELFSTVPQGRDLEQLPSGEYYDDLSSTKISLTRRSIELAIGLKYDEFCRTVFLAQGEFDAFLKRDDDRARLLELITGDQLYSKISDLASERQKIAEHRLSELKSEIEEGLIGDDELQQRRTQLEETRQSLSELRARHNEHHLISALGQQALTKAQELLRRSEEQSALKFELDELYDRAHPMMLQLLAHEALISAAFDYEGQVEERTELETQSTTCQREERDAQERAKAIQTHVDDLMLQRDELAQLHQSGEMILERLERAQERLTESQDRASHLEMLRDDVDTERQEKLKQITETEAELNALSVDQSQHETWIVTHQHYDQLIENRERWSSIFNQLQQLAELSQKQERERYHWQTESQQVNTRYQDLQRRQGEVQREHDRLTEELALLRARAEDQSTDQIERSQEAHQESSALVRSAQQLMRQLREKLERREELKQRAQSVRDLTAELTVQERDQQLQVRVVEARRQELERTLSRYDKLKILEPLREHLTQGDPCPLCGSTEHPGVPETLGAISDEDRQRLSELEVECDQLKEILESHQEKLLTEERNLRWFEEQIDHSLTQLQADFDSWNQLKNHQSWGDLISLQPLLRSYQHLSERALNLAGETAPLEELSDTLYTARATLDAQQAELAQQIARLKIDQERSVHIIEHQQREAQKLNELREDQFQLDDRQQTISQELERVERENHELNSEVHEYFSELSIYSAQPLAPCSPAELSELRAVWHSRCEEWELRRGAYAQQKEAIQRKSRALDEAHQRFAELKIKYSEYQRDRDALEDELNERRKALSELEPLIAERALSAQKLKDVEQALSEAQASRMQLTQDDLRRQRTLGELRARIDACTRSLNAYRETLDHLRISSGVSEEELIEMTGVMRAIDDNEFSRHRDQHQALSDQLTQTHHHIEDLLGPLDGQLVKLGEVCAIPEMIAVRLKDGEREAYELLETELNQLKEALGELTQEIDDLIIEEHQHHEVITRHERAVAQQSQESDEVKLARREVSKWRKINDTLGSGKHKGFNAYAQQFTLELIIEHANYYLNQLMKRYQLMMVRDDKKPLNFQVVDRDLGDEPRSVNSLSGGESFLISLALALGLSSTTSHDTHIESLFIDEGFGTLDPDALDMAISMLDQLQLSGIQIGIISHVEGISERIGTQLEVKKTGAGKSQLQIRHQSATALSWREIS